MAAPAKFLFDLDFGTPDKARERAATAAEIAEKGARRRSPRLSRRLRRGAA